MRASRVVGILAVVLAALPLIAARGASTLEAFAVYEDWTRPTIRSDRWRGSEVPGGQEIERTVKRMHLSMRFRMEGLTSSDVGFGEGANIIAAANPALITELAADARVDSAATMMCATNPRVSRTRALGLQIIKFNDGSSTGTGDRTGDYMGRVQVVRDSDSVDPPGVLAVIGSIHRCQNADCSDVKRFGGDHPLGTVLVGAKFQVRVLWDQAGKSFLFGLDANPDEPVAYTASDSAPAVLPTATLEERNTPANCSSGKVVTDSAVRVYKVYANSSAVIP